MDGSEFVGEWLVIAGAIPPEKDPVYHVVISEDSGNYKLQYKVNGGCGRFTQTLYFNTSTKTLNSDPNDGEDERCVAFWSRTLPRKNCIFAMRRENAGLKPLLPFEKRGAWGAEGG